MRVSPSSERASGNEKRNAAHNQAARGEPLHFCRIGPKPYTTVLSKSVGRAFALS